MIRQNMSTSEVLIALIAAYFYRNGTGQKSPCPDINKSVELAKGIVYGAKGL